METTLAPFVLKFSLLDRIEMAGFAGWLILFLALLLVAMFVVMLLARRSNGSILAFLAASLLPLVTGFGGYASKSAAIFSEIGSSGIADPMAMASYQQEMFSSLLLGSIVSFLGLSCGAVLALAGPSKASSGASSTPQQSAG